MPHRRAHLLPRRKRRFKCRVVDSFAVGSTSFRFIGTHPEYEEHTVKRPFSRILQRSPDDAREDVFATPHGTLWKGRP
jgi:hypothetical protein